MGHSDEDINIAWWLTGVVRRLTYCECDPFFFIRTSKYATLGLENKFCAGTEVLDVVRTSTRQFEYVRYRRCPPFAILVRPCLLEEDR